VHIRAGLIRRRIEVASLLVAVCGFAWAILLITVGGVDVEILGQRVRSHDPFRPLFLGAIGLAIFMRCGGPTAYRRWFDLASRLNERRVVAAFAVMTLGLGVAYATTVAGGADPYGYVSQADLWLRGSLKVSQPWVADLPWPSRRWSASPLGYRPIEKEGVWAIEPTYSPGLPLMMATAKSIGHHGAVFWVVPLCGAVLVLATYGLGQRLSSSRAGVVGSWLVATNPTFLFMLFQPMSDVPVSAAWAIAFYFLLANTAWAATGAGIMAALAILIRPNLFWAAGVLGLWFALRLWRSNDCSRWRVVTHGAAFSLTTGLGILAVALVNQYLYGSPFESGYGSLSDNFKVSRLGPNFRNYFGWIIDTQTPIVMAGAAAIFAPIAQFWPAARDRRVFLVVAMFVTGIWLMYCSYLVFDVWLYLRFLLPSSPFLMIGVGAVALALMRSRSHGTALAIGGLLIALGVFQFKVAVDRGAFRAWRDERRYVSVGKLVRTATDRNSLILSMIHSGSVRYYAGRMTLRYDLLDPGWLDAAVEWLSARGVHPYLLVDKWEIAEFEQRFAGERTVSRVRGNPLFVYKGATTVFLFDLTQTTRELAPVFTETLKATRSVPPVDDPALIFK
jgi:hypothetical protein